VETKPALTLYVTTDCSACTRTEEVLRACDNIMSLVRLEIVLLGGEGVERPANVIGAPTLMFQGEIVSLGTPDCIKLAAKLKASFPVDALN
jgi:hypothetical protein